MHYRYMWNAGGYKVGQNEGHGPLTRARVCGGCVADISFFYLLSSFVSLNCSFEVIVAKLLPVLRLGRASR